MGLGGKGAIFGGTVDVVESGRIVAGLLFLKKGN